ncbi:MAG: efflux RND transporter permease subunit [Candidatus Omnitrophica bacterium]|nr:efflux RND transporter permease subunit [Candidatus Omnitrophota bacterium]
MTFSDISIKNPVFAWMLMIGIIVFGWISFVRLGISQMPDVDFPVVSVSVTWENASPEVMETDVTDILEDAVMSVEGIQSVSSVSRKGQSQLTIEFNLKRDIDAALQEVQTKIAQAQRNLPTDIDPPVVTKTNPEDQPIIWITLSGDKSIKELTHYVSETLKDQFTSVAGVGSVNLGGFVDPNLRVWLDAKKMQEREVTVEDVTSSIAVQHVDQPAGYMDSGNKEINVRVYGEATSPEEFQNIIIPQRVRGGPVWNTLKLNDIGRVEDGLADVRRIARTWGKPCIGMGIIKQRGTNSVAVADAVKKRMKDLEPQLPKGTQLNLVFDSSKFIKDSVDELKFNLMLSVILTSIVCFLFLGSWTATLNVLLAIPTSLMGAFMVIYFMGFTINTFTMLGLSLVIGIIVDDAIMVLENISRHQEKGFNRRQAALIGARQITFAALAASLAILAIFVPVIFMEGIVGKFFYQFGVTISVAVIFSLLEALTIAPMRCSQFLDVGHTTALGRVVDAFMKKLNQSYHYALSKLLRFPVLVLVLASALFISSLFLSKLLKKEFVPSQDQGRFIVRLTTPLGSSLHATDEVYKKVEALLMQRPEVQNLFASIGSGSQANSGMLFVTLKDKKDRPMFKGHHITQQELAQNIRPILNKVPGVERAVIQDTTLSAFTAKRGFPIEFTVQGPNWTDLGKYSSAIMESMKKSGLYVDVDTDYLLGMPELQIKPDRAKAAEHGVSIDSIANTINSMIGGVRSGKFTSNGKRYDVRVQLTEDSRSKPEDIQNIFIRNQYGELVRLSDVTTSDITPTLFAVNRNNRERAISIFANPAPGHSQQEGLDKVKIISKEILPEGYHIAFSGGAKAFAESFQGLIFTLILGIFVAYMVLATQFNSFVHPFTVLLALPFSITGAYGALFLSNNSINLYSMIGLILLMGIVKKNSILLVDFTNEQRKQGLNVKDALLTACPIRLRPILMTSIATVAAAIPLSLAIGPGSEVMIPMAVSIVGGVTVSTFLTLFVVPCAYLLLSKLERKTYQLDNDDDIPNTDNKLKGHL